MERTAEFLLLQFQLPDGALCAIAVLLFDHPADKLHVRSRRNLTGVGPHDQGVLNLYLSQLTLDAATTSGEAILGQLEDSLSNSIRITERIALRVDNLDTLLDELVARHLE